MSFLDGIVSAAPASASGSTEALGSQGSDAPTSTLVDAVAAQNEGIGAGANANANADIGADTNTDANADSEAEAASSAERQLKELEEKRAADFAKLEEKYAAKAFALRQKSESLSKRRARALDVLEVLRKQTRDHLGKPFMDDVEVDEWISSKFKDAIGGQA